MMAEPESIMKVSLKEEGVYCMTEYRSLQSIGYDIPLRMDMRETTSAYVIETAVGGLWKEQMMVAVEREGRMVYIGVDTALWPGVMLERDYGPIVKWVFQERVLKPSVGKFWRSFWFATGFDVDKVKVRMGGGVCTVILPKREPPNRAQFKTINISTS